MHMACQLLVYSLVRNNREMGVQAPTVEFRDAGQPSRSSQQGSMTRDVA